MDPCTVVKANKEYARVKVGCEDLFKIPVGFPVAVGSLVRDVSFSVDCMSQNLESSSVKLDERGSLFIHKMAKNSSVSGDPSSSSGVPLAASFVSGAPQQEGTRLPVEAADGLWVLKSKSPTIRDDLVTSDEGIRSFFKKLFFPDDPTGDVIGVAPDGSGECTQAEVEGRGNVLPIALSSVALQPGPVLGDLGDCDHASVSSINAAVPCDLGRGILGSKAIKSDGSEVGLGPTGDLTGVPSVDTCPRQPAKKDSEAAAAST